jgi:uncharacterized cofD-like protein
MKSRAKIVVIGGGTGSFALLSVFKNYFSNISAIVNMSDDGGSTGILRDELGVLPPGDVRQCLVALSRSPKAMRDLFNFRFGNGALKGHSFGNLFLTAMEKTTGNFAKAVKTAAEILNCSGKVIPVTLDNITLVMRDGSGRVVMGEAEVTKAAFQKQGKPDLMLEPEAIINPDAASAIKTADIVVIAPGNLYASIIPALLAKGTKQALKSSRGKIVYVANLVTKPGQTDGLTVSDFAAEIERFLGSGRLNCVLYNTAKPDLELLKKYAAAGEHWVGYNKEELAKKHYQAIGANLVSKNIKSQDPNDSLARRTLIRHDGARVANVITQKILNTKL